LLGADRRVAQPPIIATYFCEGLLRARDGINELRDLLVQTIGR
jgi:hypothetical protein